MALYLGEDQIPGIVTGDTAVTIQGVETEVFDAHVNDTTIHVTDAEKNTWNAKSEFSGDYNDLTNKPAIPSVEGLATTEYVDGKIAAIPTPDVSGQINAHNTATNSHNDIRLLVSGLADRLNALANSDDTTLDQMAEIVEYIKDNRELIEQITTNKVSVSDIIDNLTTNVDNKPLSAAQGVAIKALIDALQTAVDSKASATHNHDNLYYTETEIDIKISSVLDRITTANVLATAVIVN